MTKKDYILIALGINRAYRANIDIKPAVDFLKNSVVPELIILLAGNDIKFNTRKFKKICFEKELKHYPILIMQTN
jgi:hypothetical protein